MELRVLSGVIVVEYGPFQTLGSVTIDFHPHRVSGDGVGQKMNEIGVDAPFIDAACHSVSLREIFDSKLDQTSGPERKELSRWNIDTELDSTQRNSLTVKWNTQHADRRGRGSTTGIRELSYLVIGTTKPH